MSWFNLFKGKSDTPVSNTNNVITSATEKSQPQKKDEPDPLKKLWNAQSHLEISSLITRMTDKELSDLVSSIAFVDYPLNAIALAKDPLDKRSTLTIDFILQLLKMSKHTQANQLIDKVLDKMRTKLTKGAREEGSLPQCEEQQAFESAVKGGDTRSAAEILKQCKNTDFWRIDEVLKLKLYGLSMEMLKKDREKDAALLLDAVMLDYPQDLDTEYWRVVAYHNIFISNKSDNQAKHNAEKAIESFLHQAEGSQQYADKCLGLRKIMSELYDEASPAKQNSLEPEVEYLRVSTKDPEFATYILVKYLRDHGCGCGGKWNVTKTADLYQCDKCGAKKVLRLSLSN